MQGDLVRLGLLVLGALDDPADGKLLIEEARVRVSELVAARRLPEVEGHEHW